MTFWKQEWYNLDFQIECENKNNKKDQELVNLSPCAFSHHLLKMGSSKEWISLGLSFGKGLLFSYSICKKADLGEFENRF